MLHLPAIAHECGIELSFDMANEISQKTPNLCHLAPAGPTHMPDLYAAGGIPAVQAELAKRSLLDLGCLTVTGKTVGAGQYEKMKEYSKTVQMIFLFVGLISGAAVFLARDASSPCTTPVPRPRSIPASLSM